MSYAIIARRFYSSISGEYSPGDLLKNKEGEPLLFASGTEAMEYARKHEGESVVEDGVLDWWKLVI